MERVRLASDPEHVGRGEILEARKTFERVPQEKRNFSPLLQQGTREAGVRRRVFLFAG